MTATVEKSAPPAKKPKPRIERSDLDRVLVEVADRREQAKLVNELLMRRAGGEAIEGDYDVFFASGLTREKIEAELLRCQRVLAYQRQAGTKADRVRADQSAVDSQSSLATEGAKIDREIAELSRRKAELVANARAATELVRRQGEAIEKLRDEKLLPEFLRRTLGDKLSAYNAQSQAVELRNARARLDTLTDVMNLEPSIHREAIANYAEAQGLYELKRAIYTGDTGRLSTLWGMEVERLKAELQQLAERADVLTEWEAPRLVELDALRNVLIDEIG